MMKKMSFLIIFMLFMSSCGPKIIELSNEEGYKDIINKKYILNKDFVVMSYGDNLKELVLNRMDSQNVPQINEDTKYPVKYYSNIIRGILPRNNVIELRKVVKSSTFETTNIYVKAIVVSEGPFKGRKIDVSLIVGGKSNEIPYFHETDAIELK